MKRLIITLAVFISSYCHTVIAADLGVSVSVGEPGFYGRLDIGGYPQPQLIYRQPRVIQRSNGASEPVYLHVPPGHAKNWKKHCSEYNACGENVYFVQDNWYNRQYAPRYREQHHGEQRRGQGNDHNHGNSK